jgi:hypothetical protein
MCVLGTCGFIVSASVLCAGLNDADLTKFLSRTAKGLLPELPEGLAASIIEETHAPGNTHVNQNTGGLKGSVKCVVCSVKFMCWSVLCIVGVVWVVACITLAHTTHITHCTFIQTHSYTYTYILHTTLHSPSQRQQTDEQSQPVHRTPQGAEREAGQAADASTGV